MDGNTVVTALADGAKNCWSVVAHLEPHCQRIESILDWFHIGKKFQNVMNALETSFEKSLESCKWEVWNGKVQEALSKLEILRANVSSEEKCSKVQGLYDYLNRNQGHIVNYNERREADKVYTSHVAESHIGAVINARHKKTGKMQWSREGAHNVLQIRAAITSQEWASQWQEVVLAALGAVA